MRKAGIALLILCCLVIFRTGEVRAHFGAVIPSDDIIGKEDSKVISLNLRFFHPMEGHLMEMAKPDKFSVMHGGEKTLLSDILKEKKVGGFTTWQAAYKIKRPGDHIFYLEPQPYWEPAEDCFIVHYAKACVSALGLEEGWDKEIGLETEIIPLTRPYGLWTGNVFTGKVLVGGNPVSYAEVEVEYYNEGGKIKPPADPYITQVIKADMNGIFSYAMPREGWWGFAALNTARRQLDGPDGKKKSIEIGAVIWVRTRDMK